MAHQPNNIFAGTQVVSLVEVRWKHAMHLLRLLLTSGATLREARVPVRVEANRERLLSVKRGEPPWAEVDAWRKKLAPVDYSAIHVPERTRALYRIEGFCNVGPRLSHARR